jgi:transposase InsO family protein
MNEWFLQSEILKAAGKELPNYERGLRRYIAKHNWKGVKDAYRKRSKKLGGDLFHISLLPAPVQIRLKAIETAQSNEPEKPAEITTGEDLWAHYEQLPLHQKQECAQRLKLIQRVDELYASGLKKVQAISVATAELGYSVSTYRNWVSLIHSWDRKDWLAALAPKYNTEVPENTCHPKAWAVLKSDYLRPEKPSLSACYRRAKAAAKKHGWEPIPSLRTIRRWVERELPRSVQIMAREKGDVSKQLYPAQKRTKGHFHAMEMVNIDGHKFDVFVKLPNGRIIRPMMIAIQDVYSGMFVAHRLAESENKEAVRLCIGDMIEKHGIPTHMISDNGRAFASKWITGGSTWRFRFRVRDEEPQGLLESMGTKVTFTQPYSGQSKPIERAFRDLADTIARHPFVAGAWTGNTIDNAPDNRGGNAIDFDLFKDFVEAQINEHNARTDRNTETAKGRSFLEVFNESMALPETLVPMPTAGQRKLWLLAAEQIKAKRGSGEIELLGTRYWTPLLNQYAGKKLTIRFDPQNLHKPIQVYDLKDKFLFEAEAISDVRFDDKDAAQSHGRKRRELLKATKTQQKVLAELSIDELSRILPSPDPIADDPTPPKVRRLATGGARPALVPPHQQEQVASHNAEEIDFEASFSRAVNQLGVGADILSFPTPEDDE